MIDRIDGELKFFHNFFFSFEQEKKVFFVTFQNPLEDYQISPNAIKQILKNIVPKTMCVVLRENKNQFFIFGFYLERCDLIGCSQNKHRIFIIFLSLRIVF